MGDYARQQSTTPPSTGPTQSPPSGSTGASTQDTHGNAFVQGQVGTNAGRLNYQQALGNMLGTPLYDALAGQLTDDKLVGHAQSAVGKATEALAAYLKGQVQPNEQEAAALFVKALDGEMRRIAAAAVVDSGASQGARDLVDHNPLAVATAAVAGAVAYVLSNQDLPLFEQKLGLGGGHSLLAGIDVGRTMHLALEQVRVGYRYQSGGTQASVIGDRFQDGGWQVQGAFQQTLGAGEQVRVQGTHIDRPGENKSRVDLNYANPNLAAGAYWERSRGEQQVDAFGGSLSTVTRNPNDLNGYLRGEYRTDGSYSGAAGLSRQMGQDGRWSVEGYTGRTPTGQNDSGIRAMLQFRF